MTTTLASPASRTPEPSDAPPTSRAAVVRWLWVPFVLLATVGSRAFGNGRGYDVFVDEVTYLRVS